MAVRFFYAPLVGLIGCSELIGADEYSVAARGLTCGPVLAADPKCQTCSASNCSVEEAACRANSECNALARCLTGCAAEDADCRASCMQTCAPESEEAHTLIACRREQCSTNCSACGGLYDTLGTACSSCIAQACCPQVSDCLGSADCAAFLRQFDTCGANPSCLETQWLDPRAKLLSPASECITTSCASECRLGRDWSCVGHFGWPPAKTDPIRVTLGLTSSSEVGIPIPVPNAQTSACDRLTQGCKACEPGGSAGSFFCDVPTNTDVFVSGFEGFFRAEAPGYMPLLRMRDHPFYMDRPLPIDMFRLELKNTYEATVPLQDTRGHLLIIAVDCLYFNSPGLSFEVTPSEGSTHLYFQGDKLPVMGLTQTDRRGQGLVVNVPVGPANVIAREVLSGRVVAGSSALVEADKLTVLGLYPADDASGL